MKKLIIQYKKHIYFWGSIYAVMLLTLMLYLGFWEGFLRSVIMGIPVLILVYANLEVLIPYFLSRRRFWEYVLYSTFWLIVITAFRYYLDLGLLRPFPMGDFFQNSYESRLVFYYWTTNNFFFYISLIYSLSVDLSREKQQKAELQKQHLEAELKFLKYQLNPHFLLNTLNNLFSMTYRQHPAAPLMLLKLSECMKYLLYECQDDVVDMEDEVIFIENYIELSKIRLDYPERVRFKHQGIRPGQKVPPLLFLAFVENVFKHSDTDASDLCYAELCLKVSPEHIIIFEGENTVLGKESNLREKSGIGLHNIRQRLDILYPCNYILDVKEDKSKFSFYLQIPKNL